jgi:hypothetical protein
MRAMCWFSNGAVFPPDRSDMIQTTGIQRAHIHKHAQICNAQRTADEILAARCAAFAPASADTQG